MNPRTKTVPSAALYPVAANEGETPITGFPGDAQDLFNLGIGEMLELERASLASFVSLNSCAIEVCKHAFGFPLFVAPLLGTMTKSLQSCLELQSNWLGLLMPFIGSTADCDPVPQDPPAPEQIEAEYAEDFIVETFENY
jgi:hypothetical protein